MSNAITTTVCRRCKVVVQHLQLPDETRAWVHGRSWESYDHDPDPVQVPIGSAQLTCDYCGDLGPRWRHTGSDVQVLVGEKQHSMGPFWAACDTCDQIARRGDVEAMLRRIFESAAGDAAFSGGTAFDRDYQRQIIGSYLPSIRRRELIPAPPAPPAELSPQRLPKARERLIQLWDGQWFQTVLASRLPAEDPIQVPGQDAGVEHFQVASSKLSPETARRFADRMTLATQMADLYWVSAEFATLAITAGKKLPDLTITRDEMPSACGLLVWANPIIGMTTAGRDTLVMAASWTLVAGGVWLTLYCQPEQQLPEWDREDLRNQIGYLLPISPGAGLEFGSHHARHFQTGGAGAWATLLSTWFLMAQPGVGTVTEQQPDRKARQQAARAGRTPPTVRIVDLRRQKNSAAQGEDGRTFHYSVRFLVGGGTGGFWRDQAHGPARSQRKRIWISPYMKGPQGAPLKTDTPTVKVLK